MVRETNIKSNAAVPGEKPTCPPPLRDGPVGSQKGVQVPKNQGAG